jgi:hypothetical protein
MRFCICISIRIALSLPPCSWRNRIESKLLTCKLVEKESRKCLSRYLMVIARQLLINYAIMRKCERICQPLVTTTLSQLGWLSSWVERNSRAMSRPLEDVAKINTPWPWPWPWDSKEKRDVLLDKETTKATKKEPQKWSRSRSRSRSRYIYFSNISWWQAKRGTIPRFEKDSRAHRGTHISCTSDTEDMIILGWSRRR